MMTGYFEWAEISSVPWYVYVSGGVILLLTLLWPKILKELTTKQIFIFFSICFVSFGLLLIFLTSFAGRDDAGTVFKGAVQFNAGNFSLIKPGAYFYRYPHQLGLLSFERFGSLSNSFTSYLSFLCIESWHGHWYELCYMENHG